MTNEALIQAILDLGLEDAIPLWEIADDCRAADLIAAGSAGVEELGEVLLVLARDDKIRFLVGRWDDPEPRQVGLSEAAVVLGDVRRYSSADEIAADLERVYYVNVDNIVE